MNNTKLDAMAAVVIVKDACRQMDINGAISQQTAITVRAQLTTIETLIERQLADDLCNDPSPCADYSAADLNMTQGQAHPDQWVNIYAVNGMIRDGATIHQSKALADLYWQVDADLLGLDIEDDGFRWVGAVEYSND